MIEACVSREYSGWRSLKVFECGKARQTDGCSCDGSPAGEKPKTAVALAAAAQSGTFLHLARASSGGGGGPGAVLAGHGHDGLGVCNCVYRSIFVECLRKYWQIEETPRMGGWFARGSEYRADFELIARRTLPEFELRIFRLHYILCADWRMCCRALRMERGNFFHSVYRIQQQLGLAFLTTKPYAIWPVAEYFSGLRAPRRRAEGAGSGGTGRRAALMSSISNAADNPYCTASFITSCPMAAADTEGCVDGLQLPCFDRPRWRRC